MSIYEQMWRDSGLADIPPQPDWTTSFFGQNSEPEPLKLPPNGKKSPTAHHKSFAFRASTRKPSKSESPKPRLGEVRLSEFCESESKKHGVPEATVRSWVNRGDHYVGLRMRHASVKCVFVKPEFAFLKEGGSHHPEAGEVTMKQFCCEEAEKYKVDYHTIYTWISRDFYVGLKVRKVNSQYCFVDATNAVLERKKVPSPMEGEVAWKDYAATEAEKCGVSVNAIYNRLSRGEYEGKLELRRVNKRVVFVKEKR